MANGIVMIRMAQMTPARTYRIAIHQPHRISQITLRISLMITTTRTDDSPADTELPGGLSP